MAGAFFTPVCTTEFIALAKRAEEFKSVNTELLSLSIDSHYSHVSWVRNIKEKFAIDIPFPIIADLDMKVAKSYGMIHPGAAEARMQEGHECVDWYFCKKEL